MNLCRQSREDSCRSAPGQGEPSRELHTLTMLAIISGQCREGGSAGNAGDGVPCVVHLAVSQIGFAWWHSSQCRIRGYPDIPCCPWGLDNTVGGTPSPRDAPHQSGRETSRRLLSSWTCSIQCAGPHRAMLRAAARDRLMDRWSLPRTCAHKAVRRLAVMLRL